MPLTEAQLKTMTLKDIGDPQGLTVDIELLWIKYDYLAIYDRYLQARVDGIDQLIAASWPLVQVSGDGRTMYLQQTIDNLLKLRATFVGELSDAAETAGFTPEVSQMTTTAPEMSTDPYWDPNSGIYRGSPIALRNRRPIVP